jgi:hypothetical protein
MAITHVGVSAMFAAAGSSGAPGSQDIILPSTAENDYLLAVCMSNQSVAVSATTPTFTFTTSDWLELTNPATSLVGNVRVRLFRKFAADAEPDPTVTVSERAGGWSTQVAAYRGVDQLAPEHLTVATSGITTSTSHTPDSRTTEDDDAWVLAIVAADQADTGISLSPTQSFNARMSGSGYATTQGGDHSIALADKAITPAGAVTMPTFNITSSTTWLGLTLALQPALGTLIQRTVSGTLTGVLEG